MICGVHGVTFDEIAPQQQQVLGFAELYARYRWAGVSTDHLGGWGGEDTYRSIRTREGKLLAIVGIMGLAHLPGCAYVWAVIDHEAGQHFMTVHRAVEELLKLSESRFRMLYLAVAGGFEQAHRWAQMLRFTDLEWRTDPSPTSGRVFHIYCRMRGL